jgi:hypothetical protein
MLAGQTNPLGRIRIVKFPIKWIHGNAGGCIQNIVFNINPFKQIKWNQITIEEIEISGNTKFRSRDYFTSFYRKYRSNRGLDIENEIDQNKPQTISILQTTDVRQIHPHDELFWENGKAVLEKTGGYVTWQPIERVEKENPNTYTIDTGDMFQ